MTNTDTEITLETYSQKEVHEHIIDHSKKLCFISHSLKELQEKVQRVEANNLVYQAAQIEINNSLKMSLDLLSEKLSSMANVQAPISEIVHPQVEEISQQLLLFMENVESKHQALVKLLGHLKTEVGSSVAIIKHEEVSLINTLKIRLKKLLKLLHLIK